jgi:hypothetical protein
MGILLKSSGDEVPITAYSALSDMFTDRENSLTVRRGWARIGATPSEGSFPHGYLKGASDSYRYCKSGTSWCRAQIGTGYSAVASGLSSTKAAFVTTSTLAETTYMFLADGTKFIKDYNGVATDVGMNEPSTPLTLTKTTASGSDITVIDRFDSGVALWNTSLLTGTGTATGSSISDGYSSNAMRVAVSDASSVGRSVKNMDLDLGFSDDLTLEFYVRCPSEAAALNMQEVVLAFSIGDTTFNTRYEKVLTTNAMQLSITTSQVPIDAQTAQQQWIEELQNRIATQYQAAVQQLGPELASQAIDTYIAQQMEGYQQSLQQYASQYAPTGIPLGVGVWNVVRVPKSEFRRVGVSLATDPLLNWGDVKAVGVSIISNANGGSSFDIDELIYRAVGQISGINISYTFTYYDSLTGTESGYATAVNSESNANRDQFTITFADSPPPSATHRVLYRMGGSIEQFQEVARIAVATTSYVDDTKDADLGDALDTDIENIPSTPRGVVAYDNRLFCWGMSSEAPNVLRFSMRNRLEIFPQAYWIPVGDGTEKIIRCMEFDGELMIFTLTKVYRLIGTDVDSYRAIATKITQGLVSDLGLAKSTSSLFMISSDGVYEFPSGKRITEAINPIWREQTVNGIDPIILSNIESACLGYFNQKLYFSYKSDNSATGNNALLVYDLGYERWHFYNYGVTEFFSEPADPDKDKSAILLAGVCAPASLGNSATSMGAFIHQIETGNIDVKPLGNAGIDFKMVTKELDLGSPDNEKQLIDLVVDADTNSTELSVYYVLDSGKSDDPESDMVLLGTVNTAGNGRQQTIIPFPNSEGRSCYGRRLQLKISGTSDLEATYDSQIKIFKLIPRFLIEPPLHKNFTTDWADEGTAGEKIWRELHIEYNSYGNTPLFHIEVDGDEVYSFYGTPSTVRRKFYYSFPVSSDIIGSKARLRIELV